MDAGPLSVNTAGATVMENEFEAVAVGVPLCAILRRLSAGEAAPELMGVSVTEAVKVKVPKAVGVPVMAPVAVLDRLSPGGSEPVAMENTYGVLPPVAPSVEL